MDLDTIYKSKLPESHEAGLKAVFDAGLAQAAEAFIASQAPVDPAPVDPAPVDPVV